MRLLELGCIMEDPCAVQQSSFKRGDSSVPSDPACNAGEAVDEARQMTFLLDLQSILKKLQETSVRMAFVSLKIVNVENPQCKLQSFDALYQLLTPEWHYDLEVRKTNIATVLRHVSKLLSESGEILHLPESDVILEKYSYSAWLRSIRKLMASTYWQTGANSQKDIAVDNRVFSELKDTEKSSDLCRNKTVNFPLIEKSHYVIDIKSEETENSAFGILEKRSSKPESRSRSYWFRGRVARDYGDTTSASSEDSDSSEDSLVYRRRRKSYYPREIVPPEPFNMEGKVSLRKFFETYERYFERKYDGNQRDCTRELSRFISGELKEAYDALGGSQQKYRDMKEMLLQWYKTQRVGRSHRWKAELQQAEMKDRESLKLYCMRLEELAQRAYSNDERECVKQLKARFLKTAPSDFLRHVEERERIKVALREGKSLSWGEIVELAEYEDKKRKKLELQEDADVIDVDVLRRLEALRTVGASASLGTVVQEPEQTSRIYQNSKRKTNANETVKQCNWCGRVGHLEQDCWKKKGVCTLCGSRAHTITACSKYTPRRVPAAFSPKCSICDGDHCGQHCPRGASTSGNSNVHKAVDSSRRPLN